MPSLPAFLPALLGGLLRGTVAVGCMLLCAPASGHAAEGAAVPFTIASNTLSLEAPAGFEKVEPKSGMIETEFAVPSDGELAAGRMTIMGAGGSIDANVDRWCGQFTQPDGGDTKEKVTKKSLKVAGCTATIVDIPGTYLDKPGGPFAGGPTITRPGYRMLAAIVETPETGNYYIKFYGPAATVERHAAGFQKMVEGMVPAAR